MELLEQSKNRVRVSGSLCLNTGGSIALQQVAQPGLWVAHKSNGAVCLMAEDLPKDAVLEQCPSDDLVSCPQGVILAGDESAAKMLLMAMAQKDLPADCMKLMTPELLAIKAFPAGSRLRVSMSTCNGRVTLVRIRTEGKSK